MENFKINIENIYTFLSKETISKYASEMEKNNIVLNEKTGKGNDFLGWVKLPTSISADEISEMQATAGSFSKYEVVVVIGIGGSYLGAKSVIEALSNNFQQLVERKAPLVLFAGQNLSEDYMFELCDVLKTKSWAIVSISKSGTTTEPAVCFRILKKQMEEQFGKGETKQRIIAITDKSKGALRTLATKEGYKTYTIPDDVGGRFSVLTPVGLIPIAIAGFDIKKLVEGAVAMQRMCEPNVPFENNPAAIYAAARNALYKAGKNLEILVNYNPKLVYIAEWWKQLYGESEGKEGKGIFPASVTFTADLHSMGQYIQEGTRNIFETVISIKSTNHSVEIPHEESNLDQMNFIAGKSLDFVNKMAELGTVLAHVDGGVPNIQIELGKLNEFSIGQLLYFFEIACGISGYTLDVNPFDQPGVEAYKKNMFALLGKPGFEKETEAIKKRIE